MPHCIIEYASELSSEINVDTLVETVHHSSLNTGLFSENQIKCRAVGYENYLIGASKKAFVHVTIKILAGRTIEQKAQLGQLVLTDLKKLLDGLEDISVEVLDLANEAYFK